MSSNLVQEKKQKALPGATTDLPNGEQAEISTTIIELPEEAITTLKGMVSGTQPQCTIGSVLVQNGLTTSQVVSL